MAQRDLNFSVPANSGINLAVKGDFIYLKSASADVLVFVNEQAISMSAGDTRNITKYELHKFTDPDTRERVPFLINVGFTDIRIENETGSTITGVMVAGNGGYEKAIALGNVNADLPNSTIGNYSRSNNEQSFSGYFTYAGAAANYSYIQLFNPAASGVTLVVQAARALNYTTAIGTLKLNSYNTELVTGSGTTQNKKVDGAVPKGLIKYERAVGTLGTNWLSAGYLPAINTLYNFIDKNDPIILTAGKGIVIRPGVVNEGIHAQFDWYEV